MNVLVFCVSATQRSHTADRRVEISLMGSWILLKSQKYKATPKSGFDVKHFTLPFGSVQNVVIQPKVLWPKLCRKRFLCHTSCSTWRLLQFFKDQLTDVGIKPKTSSLSWKCNKTVSWSRGQKLKLRLFQPGWAATAHTDTHAHAHTSRPTMAAACWRAFYESFKKRLIKSGILVNILPCPRLAAPTLQRQNGSPASRQTTT